MNSTDRRKAEDDLITLKPDLLMLCPPCADQGSWFHLNSLKQHLRRVAESRMLIRWCCKLFRIQTSAGREAVFEHPTGAKTWSYPEMLTLCCKFHTVKLHMCRYNLHLPSSECLLRKSTRLLASSEDMLALGLTCPGPEDPDHRCHDRVSGSAPAGAPKVSEFTEAYTHEFVLALLQTLPRFRDHGSLVVEECLPDTFSNGTKWMPFPIVPTSLMLKC